MSEERKVSVSVGTSMEINGNWFKVNVVEESTGKENDDTLPERVLTRAILLLDEAINEVDNLATDRINGKNPLD
jgi:hypothetical protein